MKQVKFQIPNGSISPTASEAKNESAAPPSAVKLWGSVRLTYAICAFLAMVLHTWLRNTINFVVLCMLKGNTQNSTAAQYDNVTQTNDCGIMQELNDDSNLQKTGDLEWSRSEEFTMLSSIYIGFLIITPFSGHWTDKYGGKLLFVNSLLIQALVFIATPPLIRWHYVAGFTVRIVQGILAGLGNPAIYQLFAIWSHPSERTALMSFAYGGFSVGSILSYPISGQLCRFGWENSFYAVGLLVLLICIPFYWLVYSTLDEHPRITAAEYAYLKSNSVQKSKLNVPWQRLLTSAPVYAFTFTHILHSYSVTVITITLPKMLRETMSFSLTEVSFFSMFPFLGCVLSKAITLTTFSRIEERFNLQLTKFRRILYVLVCVAINICACGIVWLSCRERNVVVFLFFVIGFFSDLGFAGAYWPSMLYVAPSFAGLIAGIANCLSTLTGIISPISTFVLVQKGTKEEWNYIFYSIIVANTLAGVVYGCWGSSKLQPWGKVDNGNNLDSRKENKNEQNLNNESEKCCYVNECFDTKL